MLLPFPGLYSCPERLLLLVPYLQFPHPRLSLLLDLLLLDSLIVLLSLLPICLPIYTAYKHSGDSETLGVDTPPEEAISLVVIANAHTARRAEEGPACQGASERDKRFFFEAAAELLQAVLLVEVADLG